MSELIISVQGEALDLFKDTVNDFYITKQVYDLTSLESRKASKTSRLKLPRTQKNLRLLATGLPSVSKDDNNTFSSIECYVSLSGFPVQGSRIAVLDDSDNQEITIQIFESVIDLFGSLSDDNISDLDWSEESFEWTLGNLTTYLNRTEGLLFGRCQYYDNKGRREQIRAGSVPSIMASPDMDINYSGIWYYTKSLIQKILDKSGIKYDDSELLENDAYNTGLLGIPVLQLFRGLNSTVDTFASAKDSYPNSDQLEVPATGDTIITFRDIIEESPSGVVDPSGEFFTVPGNGTFDFKYNITFPDIDVNLTMSNDFFFVDLKLNGSVIETRKLTAVPRGIYEYVNGNLTRVFSSGDVLQFVVRRDTNPGAGVWSLKMNCSASLSGVGLNSSRAVNISDWLPEITQRNFVKEIFKVFNVVLQSDEEKVVLKLWNNIRKRDTQDISANINRIKPITDTPAITGFYQNNIAKLQTDEQTERQDNTFTFPSGSPLLGSEGVILDSAFGVSDLAESGGLDEISYPFLNKVYYATETGSTISVSAGTDTFTVINGPQLQLGDYVFAERTSAASIQRGIVIEVSGSTGRIDGNWITTSNKEFWYWRYSEGDKLSPRLAFAGINAPIGSLYDGTNTSAGGVRPKIISFPEEANVQNLVNNNYGVITDLVSKPNRVTAWAIFTEQEFFELDPLAPVYFNGKKYYLNKVEQWRPNVDCRLDLIEIKADTPTEEFNIVDVSTSQINFGTIAPSTNHSLSFTVTNNSDSSQDINIGVITGSSVYSYSTAPVNPVTFTANESKTYTIDLTNDAALGGKTATVEINGVTKIYITSYTE